jgi:hypothetical protein
MTEEQTAKLVKRLDELNFTQGDTSVIAAVVRSVLRESKPAPKPKTPARPSPELMKALGVLLPESTEKGGAKG